MSSQPLRPPVPAILLVVLLASPALAGCAAPGNGPPSPDVTFASSMDDGQAVTGASPTPLAPPTDLVGLDGTTMEHWFGKPGLVRRDFPAEVWQYRNQACVLDVYLYPAGDGLTVAHAEVRAPQIQGDPMRSCLAKFAELKRKAVG